MNDETMKAYAEIDFILSHMPKKYIEKIPRKLVNKFKNEKDQDYKVNIVFTKHLKEQNLKKKTKTILSVLKYNYWCENKEEKQKLLKMFNENELKHQEELRRKYNPDNIFKSKRKENQEISTRQNLIIEYKENFARKIINKIKSLFIRKS